ncbi:YbgA family protein, partial [Pseudomonas aeruginosa]
AHAHWQALRQRGLSHSAIVAFHSRYKYQLLAHSPEHYRSLGRLLGEAGHYQPEALGTRYFGELMQGLRRCATRGSHGNVLLHLSGYLKRDLATEDRRELRELIEQYRLGSVPLVVPLTLLKHHFRRHPHAYIAQQAYLQPHPTELGLRNAL